MFFFMQIINENRIRCSRKKDEAALTDIKIIKIQAKTIKAQSKEKCPKKNCEIIPSLSE